jgi:hypothetical protein
MIAFAKKMKLLEELTKEEREKNCRKHSYRKKTRNIPKACAEQNEIRKKLKQVLPIKAKPIEDNIYGIDFLYNEMSLDQKFSFGALGENPIKIRVKNRRLLNNSDWTMIINKEHEAEFFETSKLASFVKKNWGLVQKRLLEKKEEYSHYAIKLEELYLLEKIEPIKSPIHEQMLEDALEKITTPKQSQTIQERAKQIIMPIRSLNETNA